MGYAWLQQDQKQEIQKYANFSESTKHNFSKFYSMKPNVNKGFFYPVIEKCVQQRVLCLGVLIHVKYGEVRAKCLMDSADLRAQTHRNPAMGGISRIL